MVYYTGKNFPQAEKKGLSQVLEGGPHSGESFSFAILKDITGGPCSHNPCLRILSDGRSSASFQFAGLTQEVAHFSVRCVYHPELNRFVVLEFIPHPYRAWKWGISIACMLGIFLLVGRDLRAGKISWRV